VNFNYDLATWIDYFFGSFICWIGGALLVGKIMLNKNFKIIKKSRLLILIPFSIITIFSTFAFNNSILKIFVILLLVMVMYKYVLEAINIKIFIYSILTYIIISLAEIIFVLLVSLFDYIFNSSIALLVTNSILSNTIIAILSIIIAKIASPKLCKYVEKINESNILVLIQFLLTLFIVTASVNYLYIEKWKFSYKMILVFIVMIGSVTLTFSLLKQYLRNKEVVSKHQMLEEYLKTSADLIDKYSSTIHKYKNNLIVIKGYIKSDIPEANKYIDSLLEKVEDKKYTWVKQLNHISIDSIRYIIYYKLSKAEENNLKIFVNVSKDINDIDSKILKSNELGHILDILGEYFDNAIYASNESKEKELNVDIYKLNNELIFNISNTFRGNLDLNSITRNGYTTKGKGHGFGLYDIDKTIKSIDILSNKYEIIDNYFITTLRVKIKEKR